MADVLHLLRTATAAEHEDVERTLDLLDPSLDRPRLTGILTRLHGFWRAAEAGLDGWAVQARVEQVEGALHVLVLGRGRGAQQVQDVGHSRQPRCRAGQPSASCAAAAGRRRPRGRGR